MYSQDSLFSSKTDFAKGTHRISSNFRGNELIYTNLWCLPQKREFREGRPRANLYCTTAKS